MRNIVTLKSISTDISKLTLEEEQTIFIVLFTISYVSTATLAFWLWRQTTFTSVLRSAVSKNFQATENAI